MSLQSPLGRARGLGSAKDGTHHWWVMRISSIAMLPLSLWLVVGLGSVSGQGYEAAATWISAPWNLTLMVLTIAVLFHHVQLGVSTIVEDYVHHEAMKVAGVIAVKFLTVLLALASIMAVLRVAFGS